MRLLEKYKIQDKNTTNHRFRPRVAMCDFAWGKFALKGKHVSGQERQKRTTELPPMNHYLKLTNEFTAMIEYPLPIESLRRILHLDELKACGWGWKTVWYLWLNLTEAVSHWFFLCLSYLHGLSFQKIPSFRHCLTRFLDKYSMEVDRKAVVDHGNSIQAGVQGGRCPLVFSGNGAVTHLHSCW